METGPFQKKKKREITALPPRIRIQSPNMCCNCGESLLFNIHKNPIVSITVSAEPINSDHLILFCSKLRFLPFLYCNIMVPSAIRAASSMPSLWVKVTALLSR